MGGMAPVGIGSIVTVVLALAPGIAFAQATPTGPTKTTLCELVKTPDQFDGKMVKFRAEFVSRFQWEGFVDETCSAKVQVGVYHVLDDLKPGQGQYAFTSTKYDLNNLESLSWRPIEAPRSVQVQKDESYQKFQKYTGAKFHWADGGICLDCPLYRITASTTGRFDYFATQEVAVRADSTSKPFTYGAGDANAPLFRCVVQSVSDVAATPIDASVYSEVKRRNISLEEANDLVFAYLKTTGCTEHACSLDQYHDPNEPEFFSFQALWPNLQGSPNLGFYEVDPRTGDVWNGVICERFESPALKRLQRAIRQRIGLTDESYRKLQRPGPMCEPGMPGVGRGK